MEKNRLEKLLVDGPLMSSHGSSKRCGVLIDGGYNESQSDHRKFTYDCDCLDEQSQDIVWEFVLSEDHDNAPPPKRKDSPRPQVQPPVVARVRRVAMHRQEVQTASFSHLRTDVTEQLRSEETLSYSPLEDPVLSPLYFDVNIVAPLENFYPLDNWDRFSQLKSASEYDLFYNNLFQVPSSAWADIQNKPSKLNNSIESGQVLEELAQIPTRRSREGNSGLVPDESTGGGVYAAISGSRSLPLQQLGKTNGKDRNDAQTW